VSGGGLPAFDSVGFTVFSRLFGNSRRLYVTGFPGRRSGVGFYSVYGSGGLGYLI